MKISSSDHNHISLKIQFELRTPPESKIEAGKKKKFLGKNADQTGRRDPDVIPIFPSRKNSPTFPNLHLNILFIAMIQKLCFS